MQELLTGPTVIFGALALFALILVVKGFRVIQQSEVMIIERLGKYHKTLVSGVNIIVPLVDKPRSMITGSGYLSRIDLREAVMNFDKQSVITKDNVTISINCLLYFKIVEPKKAMYGIENLPLAIEKLAQTTLRNVVGELELDEILSSRDVINAKLQETLDKATDNWGTKVSRVELEDIELPASIKGSMEAQLKAERDRRAQVIDAEGAKKAKILESEGLRDSQIAEAEGDQKSEIARAQGTATATVAIAEADAKARLLNAQAESEAIGKVNKAIKEGKGAVEYFVALKSTEALGAIGASASSKIIVVPTDLAALGGTLVAAKELLKSN